MRHGPPGMTEERWHLYLIEQAFAKGHDVTFTAEQIAELQMEAEQANEHFTLDELRQMYGGI